MYREPYSFISEENQFNYAIVKYDFSLHHCYTDEDSFYNSITG